MATTSTDTSLPNSDTAELCAPIEVPSYGSKGLFSIRASTHIAATPSAVLYATLDHASYGKWNSFAPNITITKQPPPTSDTPKVLLQPEHLQTGTEFTLRVYMDGSGLKSANEMGSPTPTKLVVVMIEELEDGRVGYKVVWKANGFPEWSLKAERVQEFVEVDGGTLYTTWETQGGPLAHAVKRLYGETLVKRFADWGRDLKKFVESK